MSTKPSPSSSSIPQTSKVTPSSVPTGVPPKQTPNPNRQQPRRRPRKLNKEPGSSGSSIPAQAQSAGKPNASTTATTTAAGSTEQPTTALVSSTELDALKNRVRGLEAKVEELCRVGSSRSPRRRGKGKGKGSVQSGTVATGATADKDLEAGDAREDDNDVEEELGRLEGELESARRDLDAYRPRQGFRDSGGVRLPDAGEDEFVEEIPRDEGAGMSERQVTLTGSYRIPLPTSVRMEDVKSIKEGISSAQNVARGFLEQRRAQAQGSPVDNSGFAKKTGMGKDVGMKKREGAPAEGQSWSEWIGGYSMAISRAVRSIETEAAVESRPRAAGASATRKGAERPSARKGRGLSSEQVEGLLS